MNLASLSYFIDTNYKIRKSGFDPFTRGGKYYDSDYEHFVELCTGAPPGKSIKEAYQAKKSANWDEAVKRYEPMLTGMMEEIYFIEGRKRKGVLTFCVVLAFSGYFLLAVPSIELFLSVLSAVFLKVI